MTHAPLLTGALRDRAVARLRDISRSLARPYDEWSLTSPDAENGLRSVSLALGRCGVALYHAWAGRVGIDDSGAEHAARFLQESIELLPEKAMDASLFCGFPGVAWTAEHLLSMTPGDAGEDPCADIDDALADALADEHFVPAYDLIDGLAGLGVYALERAGRPSAAGLASLILDRLEATACPQSIGLSWPSGMLTRTAQGADVAPEETYFNLGLSHGVPGVVGILARFARVPALRARAVPLLEGVVRWLLAQRLPGEGAGVFPDYVAADVPAIPARLAWCYGDPGVAASLFAAARSLENPELERTAIGVAHVAARRTFETSEVVDAGLCHGAAGVAHVFHRLHQASGDAHCGAAAVEWFEHALRTHEGRPNAAGIETFCFERTREGEYVEDPAFLTGAAGAGLALLSAVSDRTPTWDRVLLLDLDG